MEAAVIGPTMPLSIPAARIPGGQLRREPNIKNLGNHSVAGPIAARQTSARRRTGQSQLRHNLANAPTRARLDLRIFNGMRCHSGIRLEVLDEREQLGVGCRHGVGRNRRAV